MHLRIIPYCEIDGIRTYTDSTIMGFYDQMVKDGTDKILFYAGHITSREKYLAYMKAHGTFLYVLLDDTDIVGVTWLDNVVDKTAFNHFCGFSNIWGRGEDTLNVGRKSLEKLIHLQSKGEYVFDIFKGLIPSWNAYAIDYAVACGGVNLGIVPNGIWNAAKNRSEDAAFIYYTRSRG